MTTAQLIIVLNWLVNFGLPILVAFILDSKAPSSIKALVNVLLSLLSTGIVTVVVSISAGTSVDWFAIIFAFVTGFIVNGASYSHVWKPTGVAPAAALRGVKSEHTQAA